MGDDEAPEDRCGFVLEPGDVHEDVTDYYEAGTDEWYEESDAACCWREVWDGADDSRCVWHAESEGKSAEALRNARTDRPERLDGAYVPAVGLGDAIDFDGCGLYGATFDGTGLRGASFAGVNGRVSQFPVADLNHAQFHDADLRNAKFHDAELRRAQFHDADLQDAQFHDAVPWHAQFHDAELSSAKFHDANLQDAQFHDAVLGHAQFHDAELRRAQFHDAHLHHAQFPNADLWDAQFHDADLRDTQFHDADLRITQFHDADLWRAQFHDADLRRAQFHDALLWSAQFHNTDLRFSDLTDSDAGYADFTRASLGYTTFTRTNLGDATLTAARLHDAHLLDVHINEDTEFGDIVPDEARATRLTPARVSPYLRRAATTAVVVADQLDYDARHRSTTRTLHRRVRDRIATLPVLCRLHDTFHPKYEAARRWWFWYRTDRDPLDLPYKDLGKANTVYRTIQRLYRENSMPRRIDTYYVRARDTRRKQAIIDGDLPRWLYLAAQRWVMGYGERPWRVVATSGLVILGCAVAYPLVGGVTETSTGGGTPHYFAVPLPDVLPAWVGLPGAVETVLTSLYFSVVTFTTLGYGDLRPRTGAAQFLATFESLVGAFLLALLVYVLGRRATR